MGLMQIMPGTWRFERARLGLGNDPFDGRDNIMAGADYLSAMRQRYGPVGMLAAYNAGPGRYEDFRPRGRPLPMETVVYVRQDRKSTRLKSSHTCSTRLPSFDLKKKHRHNKVAEHTT